MSQRAQGRRLRRDTPEYRRSWEGVSVTSTIEAARTLAARFPELGSFIAVLEIEEGDPVQFEQTLAAPTHYDLWGAPHDMLAAVVAVMPVGPVTKQSALAMRDDMVYAIWDTETGNREGWYQSEDEALEDVRDAVVRFGRDYARSWAIALHEGDDVTPIAEGEALIKRAFGAVSA